MGTETLKEATIKDVARLAGCGTATVSRVLNDKGAVSAESRRKVIAAARELGFQFSDIGRSLRNSVTRTIGCVVPSIINPVYAAAVQGLQDFAAEADHQIVLSCTNYDPEKENAAVRMLMRKRVDALVLTVGDVTRSAVLTSVRAKNLPHCLLFNHQDEHPAESAVDNCKAAYAVGRAFADHGHRELGFVALRLVQSDRSQQRLRGLQQACTDLGLAPPKLLEIDEQDRQLDETLRGFLLENPTITGVFASNDLVAIALIRSANHLGLTIPDDLSIVGFDGIDFGQMMVPKLATIVTNPYEMGRAAGETVLAGINNGSLDPHKAKAAEFSFRIGESLGAPSGNGNLAKKLQLLRQ